MNEKMEFLLSSHVGNVRKNNEDFYGEKQLAGGHVFVVCDGMGGHSGGEIASQKAVECILDYCTRSRGENAVQMIHEAIKFANSQVHGFASMNPEYKGMGTTCVVVFITNSNKLYYGHVGDSRLYLHNKQGLRSITKDHSYVQYLVDIGDIKESEMESHPSKNQILRALGIDEVVKPEVCPEPLNPQPGDTFLLCSDGLNGMINHDEIQGILDSKKQGKTLEQVSSNLIQAALDAGGKDNVTVGLIEFGDEQSDVTLNLINSGRVLLPAHLKKYLIGSLILLLLLIGGYHILKDKKEETKTENVKDATDKDPDPGAKEEENNFKDGKEHNPASETKEESSSQKRPKDNKTSPVPPASDEVIKEIQENKKVSEDTVKND
jgi:serine/threonine protein phosphatase PrpC